MQWSPLSGSSGTGVDGSARKLAVYDDGSGEALYAGGLFPSAGGITANGMARWDGTRWSAMPGPSGTGVDGSVNELAVFADSGGEALYAGGRFATAGGVASFNIAKWSCPRELTTTPRSGATRLP